MDAGAAPGGSTVPQSHCSSPGAIADASRRILRCGIRRAAALDGGRVLGHSSGAVVYVCGGG